MKKSIILLLALVMVFSMISCSSTEAPEQAAPQAAVVLGRNGIPMPDWVNNDASTQDYLKVSGSARKSSDAISIKAAEVDARNHMAEFIATSVNEITTTYTNDAGEGANRQAIDAFETIARQQAEAMLHGSKREAKWISEDGTVHVLMSIPFANIEDQLTDLSEKVNEQVFKENDAAAAANAKMDDAIAKYFGSVAGN